MTQPIAPAGPRALHMPGQDATSVREKADAASPSGHAHSKGGADSVSISMAARRQLAVNVSLNGSQLQSASAEQSQDTRGGSPGMTEKADMIMRDMRAAFHTREGDDGFDSRMDFNQDGVINVRDMAIVRQKMADTGQPGAVTVISDQTPASQVDPAMTAVTPPVQDTASTATSPLDALRAAFHTSEGDDGFDASVDFNQDGVINARDLGMLKSAGSETTQPVTPAVESDPAADLQQSLADLRASFHTRAGEDSYNAAVDFNNDGVVNVRDLAMLRAGQSGPDDSQYTQPVAPQSPETSNLGVRANTLVQQLREAFFSSHGDSNFNAALDANGDGQVNVMDLAAARDRLRDHSA